MEIKKDKHNDEVSTSIIKIINSSTTDGIVSSLIESREGDVNEERILFVSSPETKSITISKRVSDTEKYKEN